METLGAVAIKPRLQALDKFARAPTLPARQHCPRDARHLVGKRNRHDQGRSPRQKLRRPSGGWRPLAGEPQNGGRADDQEPANVRVALFGDAAQAFFPATRMLSRNEAEPGGKLAPGGEDACISYRCSDCAGNDWADPGGIVSRRRITSLPRCQAIMRFSISVTRT